MPKLKAGDTVSCRVKSASIVGPYRSYDEIKSFVIVAVDANGYHLFVPHYCTLHGTITVDQRRCNTLGIDPKYIGEETIYILENIICGVESKQDGLNCKRCLEFFKYAVANQEDGTLLCYSCRSRYH